MSIQITSQSRIFVCLEPLDFRGGMNATAAACRQRLNKNPLEGGLFVFINKSKTMIKLYSFDGLGEGMFIKRLAVGRFHWWKTDESLSNVMIEHLHTLLRGGDPKRITFPAPWKNLDTPSPFKPNGLQSERQSTMREEDFKKKL